MATSPLDTVSYRGAALPKWMIDGKAQVPSRRRIYPDQRKSELELTEEN